jgi:hypothetical protein
MTALQKKAKEMRDKEKRPRHITDCSSHWGVVTSKMSVDHWDFLCEPNYVPEPKNKIRGMTIHG